MSYWSGMFESVNIFLISLDTFGYEEGRKRTGSLWRSPGQRVKLEVVALRTGESVHFQHCVTSDRLGLQVHKQAAGWGLFSTALSAPPKAKLFNTLFKSPVKCLWRGRKSRFLCMVNRMQVFRRRRLWLWTRTRCTVTPGWDAVLGKLLFLQAAHDFTLEVGWFNCSKATLVWWTKAA